MRDMQLGRLIDETGNRYGRLLVLERDRRGWLCQCDCGQTKTTMGSSLRGGGVKSCGCLRQEITGKRSWKARAPIDETGNKYGKLIIIEQAEGPTGSAWWLCRCDCGNTAVKKGVDLRNGSAKSCKCLFRLPDGVAALNNLFSTYKRGAKKRNLEWRIPKTKFKELTSTSCFYCGIEPSRKHHPNGTASSYFYNGLDRVDNKRGYTLGNVVPCCKECNYAKAAHSIREFEAWIKRLVQHQVAVQYSTLAEV